MTLIEFVVHGTPRTSGWTGKEVSTMFRKVSSKGLDKVYKIVVLIFLILFKSPPPYICHLKYLCTVIKLYDVHAIQVFHPILQQVIMSEFLLYWNKTK